MRILVKILAELWGLFVEDGSFAAATVVWLAIVWFGVSRYAPNEWKGGFLFLGIAGVILENVWRTAKAKAKQG